MTEGERVLPVVAHRLEPGDVILTDAEGQVQVNHNQATCRRTIASMEMDWDENRRAVRVRLAEADGNEWTVWPTDVAWLVLQRGPA